MVEFVNKEELREVLHEKIMARDHITKYEMDILQEVGEIIENCKPRINPNMNLYKMYETILDLDYRINALKFNIETNKDSYDQKSILESLNQMKEICQRVK